MKCKNCLQKVFWVFEAIRKLWNVQNSLHKKGSFPLRTFLVNVRIWSHLLKKSLMKNFIFCAVIWTILRWFAWALSNCAQTNFKKMQFIWIMFSGFIHEMQKLFTKPFLSVWSNAEVMKWTKFTTQKRKFSIKDFFSKCEDLVTFAKEILDGKLHFLCKRFQTALKQILKRCNLFE